MKKGFRRFKRRYVSSGRVTRVALSLFLTLAVVLSLFVMIPASADDVWGVDNYPIMKGYTEKTKPTSEYWSFGISDYANESLISVSTAGFAAPVAVFDADNAVENFTWSEYPDAEEYKISIYYNSTCIDTATVTSTAYTTGIDVITGGDSYLAQVKALKGGKAIAKSEVCSFVATAGVASTGYAQQKADKTVYIADGYTDETSALTNATTGAGYTFKNNSSDREVIFNAVSEGGKKYGSYLTFTAPKDGLYDFLGNVRIRDNATAKTPGTLYFRLVKIDSEGNESVAYPFDGSWVYATSDEVFPNPYIEDIAPQVSLKKNEKAVIQAYFDGNGKINIGFNNMTAVRQQTTDSYKGEVTEYEFHDYTPHFIYDGSNNGYRRLEGRWTANIFRQTDENGFQEYEFDNYGSYLMCKKHFGSNPVGYYFYVDTTKKALKMQVGYGGYGMSYNFTSPAEGKLTLSATMKNASVNVEKYRVLHNGKTVFPENGGWETVTSGGPTINVTVDAKPDDVIQYQYYKTTDGRSLPEMPKLTASIANGNNANSTSDSVFSPLWDRPWQGQEYEGSFAYLSGTVCKLGFWDASSGGRIKGFTNPNHFNSTTGVMKYVTSDASAHFSDGSHFIYKEDELQVQLSGKKHGASISFTAPARGNYDLGAALKILSGKGTVYVRVTKNNKAIYPHSAGTSTPWSIWHKFTSEWDIDSLEISAMAGDSIRLDFYGSGDWAEPIVLSLGTPTVHRTSNRQNTATGNISVYKPYDYVAFEKGYSGNYTRANSKFNYYFTPADGTKTEVSKTDSAKNQLSLGENNVVIKEDATTLNIKAGTIAEIEFIAPAKASGELQAIAQKLSGSAQFAIYKGVRQYSDYVDTIPEVTNVDLAAGDRLSVLVKATTDAKVKFTSLNVKLGGSHYNQNLASDNAFYALYSEPYDEDDYNGDFSKSEGMYWNFDLYDKENGEIIPANTYESSGKKLYSTEAENAGYTFGSPYMSANITPNYGFALGFTSPRAETFALRSGFRITTADATAEVKAKLIKISAEDGSETQLWPATEGWNTQTVATGEDMKIPFINADLLEGDKLYLLAYVENPENLEGPIDSLKINLVCPSVTKDIVSDYNNPDISASLYQAWNYSPYYPLYPYGGGGYVPMENRWNIEMLEVDSNNEFEGVVNPDYVINTGSIDEIILKAVSGWPSYKIGGNISGKMLINNSRNIGSQLRFVAPKNCEISLNAAPSFGVSEGVTVNYRILHVKTDGTEETIWPKSGEWEPLITGNAASKCKDLSLEVTAGDEIVLQSYIVRDEVITEKLASGSISVSIGLSPVAIITNSIAENKTNFSAVASFPHNLQLNPYWKYEWTPDSNNPDWRLCSSFSWNYWMTLKYAGISQLGKMWISCQTESMVGTQPAVCYKYLPRQHGFVTMSSSKSAGYIGGFKGITAQVRITKNGENVYPESGWKDVPTSFKGVEFEVNPGDEVRFEYRLKEPLKTGDDVYVSWDPTFVQNKYANYYNITGDIYSYLDDTMLATFKKMDTNKGFDQDPASSKKISDEIAKRKELAAALGAEMENDDDDYQGDYQGPDYNPGEEEYIIPGTPGTPGTEGDYSEWTEEIFTPGGGYRKIRRVINNTWWIVWLIVGISVGVLVIAAIILLILYKKGKIFKKKAKSKITS